MDGLAGSGFGLIARRLCVAEGPSGLRPVRGAIGGGLQRQQGLSRVDFVVKVVGDRANRDRVGGSRQLLHPGRGEFQRGRPKRSSFRSGLIRSMIVGECRAILSISIRNPIAMALAILSLFRRRGFIAFKRLHLLRPVLDGAIRSSAQICERRSGMAISGIRTGVCGRRHGILSVGLYDRCSHDVEAGGRFSRFAVSEGLSSAQAMQGRIIAVVYRLDKLSYSVVVVKLRNEGQSHPAVNSEVLSEDSWQLSERRVHRPAEKHSHSRRSNDNNTPYKDDIINSLSTHKMMVDKRGIHL